MLRRVDALSIARLRKRLPLIVFILLVLIVVMLVGIACACATDHPMQAIDKAVSAIPAAPAVMEVWPAIVLSLFAGTLLVTLSVPAQERASPAFLQRFLF
jgi:hypothetical protein